jgi:AraC-like DNA-binding protein
MEFKYYSPSDILKPYIKHYYVFESSSNIQFEDTVFPSGDMEIIFNLGQGTWESAVENKFSPTPGIELWGQITKPLVIRSTGRHTMLGIRFHTHSASYFLDDEINVFNNRISDLSEIIGSPANILYSQLLETGSATERIKLIEQFLLKRLVHNQKRSPQIDRVASIITSIKKDTEENNIGTIASRHGMTTRYLHKLIYQHTGLSPKSFTKIRRFQLSLKLIAKNEQPFTSIAYDCGYFDQAHFIREFKSFTGVTPSVYLENKISVNKIFLQ